jgi:hypothetical protein
LVVGFGAGGTVMVAEKHAAVHRWSLPDGAELTGLPPGGPLRSGLQVVASSAAPAIAVARPGKITITRFEPDGYRTVNVPLGRNEFLVTSAGSRLATYDRRVAVRDFSDGSVVWLQPYPANPATVTIDRTGTALAMASGPNFFAGSNKVTVVKQRDLEPREFSFGNVRYSAWAASTSSPARWPPCCARSSIRRRITCVSAWPRIFLRSSSFLGRARNWPARHQAC